MSHFIPGRYFALRMGRRGLGSEGVVTAATDPGTLYRELAHAHGLELQSALVRFASNGVAGDIPLRRGDEVCFKPPVAGG
ncbi:MAG: molybdopterin synthase sulfur carrier subunit [Fimbriimonas sp.]